MAAVPDPTAVCPGDHNARQTRKHGKPPNRVRDGPAGTSRRRIRRQERCGAQCIVVNRPKKIGGAATRPPLIFDRFIRQNSRQPRSKEWAERSQRGAVEGAPLLSRDSHHSTPVRIVDRTLQRCGPGFCLTVSDRVSDNYFCRREGVASKSWGPRDRQTRRGCGRRRRRGRMELAHRGLEISLKNARFPQRPQPFAFLQRTKTKATTTTVVQFMSFR